MLLKRKKERILNIYKEIIVTIFYIKKSQYIIKAGIFASIGSSSMASACGGSLALMDAGKRIMSQN